MARVLPTEHRPAPWGDRPADWPVLLRSAEAWLTEALGEFDVSATDDLFVNAAFVSAFVDAAGGEVRVACVAGSHASKRLRGRSLLPPGPDESVRLPLMTGFDGASADELLAAAATAECVVVDPREEAREVPVPRAWADDAEAGTMTMAASRRLGIHLTHRSLLLEANLAALGSSFVAAMGKPKILLALRYLYERFRPGPRRLFSRIGKGCRIHPTAIVEASQLGSGVEVGAYAIVRGSVIGDGVTIEDAAHVQLAIVGPRARVARQCYVFGVVLMEGAHSAQPIMQASVLGREAATTSASWFTDVRFGSHIRVEGHDGLLDTGTRFLGCDVGHGTVVGAGVTVAPGRMLPSNAIITGNPDHLLARLDEEIDVLDAGGETLTIRGGRLTKRGKAQ